MPESGTSGSVRVEPREGLLYSTTSAFLYFWWYRFVYQFEQQMIDL
jgi:hypothetical protein